MLWADKKVYSKMGEKETENSSGNLETRLLCPRCGGPVVARLAFTSQFCGIRAVACCKKGCAWESREQQELNAAASDELFT